MRTHPQFSQREEALLGGRHPLGWPASQPGEPAPMGAVVW